MTAPAFAIALVVCGAMWALLLYGALWLLR